MKLKEILNPYRTYTLKELNEVKKKFRLATLAHKKGNTVWEFMLCRDLEALGIDCDMDRFPNTSNSN